MFEKANIQDVQNIAGPLIPYTHAWPKQGMIHQDRVMQLMKQALYLQANTAGFMPNLLQFIFLPADTNLYLLPLEMQSWQMIKISSICYW